MTSPLRWDARHNLAKRPRTLDTWNFLDRASSGTDRSVRPDDPMGIFHVDNTGLHRALRLMAGMHRALGEETPARRYEDEAAALRERINRHLWTGNFYRHFLPLDPVDYGIDERRQMSLSNAYALHRGNARFRATEKGHRILPRPAGKIRR